MSIHIYLYLYTSTAYLYLHINIYVLCIVYICCHFKQKMKNGRKPRRFSIIHLPFPHRENRKLSLVHLFTKKQMEIFRLQTDLTDSPICAAHVEY